MKYFKSLLICLGLCLTGCKSNDRNYEKLTRYHNVSYYYYAHDFTWDIEYYDPNNSDVLLKEWHKIRITSVTHTYKKSALDYNDFYVGNSYYLVIYGYGF